MKFLKVIILFTSVNVLAGGNSVGTMRVTDKDKLMQIIKGNQFETELENIKTGPKIIHSSKPAIDGISKVSIGHFQNNTWVIQNFEAPNTLLLKSDIAAEIQESIDKNDWIEIQN